MLLCGRSSCVVWFSTALAAYKHADGKKIDARRIVVDVERGRTVKNWKPRRLGKLIIGPFIRGCVCVLRKTRTVRINGTNILV